MSGRRNSRGKGQEAAAAGGQCAPEEGGRGSREWSQQGFRGPEAESGFWFMWPQEAPEGR